jgi:L-lysine 6-transaminase
LRKLADEFEALLIFDEVQTGVGMTGKFWAFEHHGVEPDLIAFAKKMQVGGCMAGPRIDEEPENVFRVPSRINSTWGAHIVDMLRSAKMLQVIERDGLVERAGTMGQRLLAGLQDVGRRHPEFVTNVRGLGLMCAFDVPGGETRDAVVRGCLEDGLIVLPCGTRSVRFRPALTIAPQEIDEALERVDGTLRRIAGAV